MIVMQIVSLKLPQWLKKYDDKKNGVRRKKYLKENDNPMASTMNMTMYFTTAMIAFMYLSWPIAMSFYWFVSSCVRSLMQLYMHFVLMKKQQKKAA